MLFYVLLDDTYLFIYFLVQVSIQEQRKERKKKIKEIKEGMKDSLTRHSPNIPDYTLFLLFIYFFTTRRIGRRSMESVQEMKASLLAALTTEDRIERRRLDYTYSFYSRRLSFLILSTHSSISRPFLKSRSQLYQSANR